MLFISIILVGISQTQPPNSNFEDWVGTDSLVDWNSAIVFDLGPPFGSLRIPTAERTSDAIQGEYAVKMETYEQEFTGQIIPGMMLLGNVNLSLDDFSIGGGVEYTERPFGMAVNVKYFPAENDTAFITAYMTKYNEVSQSTDTIGLTIYPLFETIADYTEILMPFVYFSEENPDTLNILIMSTNPLNMKVGSTLFVDSLFMLDEVEPFPTLALPATDITETGFTANWVPSPYSSDYYFDLAADEEFTDIISEYNDFDVADYTLDVEIPEEYSEFDDFYYRVSVNYGDTATSINSNIINVTLLETINNCELDDFTNFYFKNNILYLYGLIKNSEVVVYDAVGRVKLREISKSSNIEIQIDQHGIYIVNIIQNQKKYSFKIVR